MRAFPGLAESPSDDELYSLAGFLAQRPCSRRAMSLEEVHGFLTALHCVPGPLPPLVWLPVIFGGDVERASGATGAHMIGVVMRLSNEIARSLFDSSNQEAFEPLIAFPGTCERVSAAGWCDGYLTGLDVKARAWIEHIEEDGEMRRVLCPIIALSSRFQNVLDCIEDDEADEDEDGAGDDEELEAMLPTAVLAAYTYWRISDVVVEDDLQAESATAAS
ncbi:MAG TPA: YecA family protein [Candidatus Limnocylindrales bacterium]|nr:YecA family protein [Candidatus Limnocylindrales bacterium]